METVTVRPSNRVAAATAATLAEAAAETQPGSTIRNIAAELHIGTELPPTGLAVRRAETPCPLVRLAHGNRLAARVEISPAIVSGATASAIGPAAD